jgi:hypothetical protein
MFDLENVKNHRWHVNEAAEHPRAAIEMESFTQLFYMKYVHEIRMRKTCHLKLMKVMDISRIVSRSRS